MRTTAKKGQRPQRIVTTLAVLAALALASPLVLRADKKKKKDQQAEVDAKIKAIDYSNIVWPNPPAIARIKYTTWYASDKAVRNMQGNVQKKAGCIDRRAETQSSDELFKRPFSLIQPYGIAVDSKGSLYVADQKVGAIFVFNPETRDVDMIKNSVHAHF